MEALTSLSAIPMPSISYYQVYVHPKIPFRSFPKWKTIGVRGMYVVMLGGCTFSYITRSLNYGLTTSTQMKFRILIQKMNQFESLL